MAEHHEPTAPPGAANSGRLTSLDALRGFDMFWIIGASALVKAFERMNDNPVTRFLSTQLQHVKWEGFRFYDLIFPLFLFIMGVSLVYSQSRTRVQGGKAAVVRRILRRSLLLFLLGVFYYGGVSREWPNIQLGGVLQRIALCYLFAALIFVTVRLKGMIAICVSLLVGYWALVTFVPFPDLLLDKATVKQLAEKIGTDSPAALAAAVPGRVSGVYEEGRNLTNYLDFRFLPGKKGQIYYINEGLLSTLPAISICLFGVFAGLLLQSGKAGECCKVRWLLAAGAMAVLVGLFWSLQFPLIKRIWSSSFVLVASGLSAILLAGFYQVVEIWKFQKWCRPFVWIGMNPITIYLAVNIMSFPKLAERFVGGDVNVYLNALAQGLGDLVVALTSLGLAVLLVWFLHRKKIFLRL